MPSFPYRRPRLTKEQGRTLARLYERNHEPRQSFLAFRRTVKHYGDYVGIFWCNMFIGIEKDGYAHS
jgi:hypothetical protein